MTIFFSTAFLFYVSIVLYFPLLPPLPSNLSFIQATPRSHPVAPTLPFTNPTRQDVLTIRNSLPVFLPKHTLSHRCVSRTMRIPYPDSWEKTFDRRHGFSILEKWKLFLLSHPTDFFTDNFKGHRKIVGNFVLLLRRRDMFEKFDRMICIIKMFISRPYFTFILTNTFTSINKITFDRKNNFWQVRL